MSTDHYRVTGDHHRMIYSRHSSEALALAAARALARSWGWSHPGSEPRVIEVATGRTLWIIDVRSDGYPDPYRPEEVGAQS